MLLEMFFLVRVNLVHGFSIRILGWGVVSSSWGKGCVHLLIFRKKHFTIIGYFWHDVGVSVQADEPSMVWAT